MPEFKQDEPFFIGELNIYSYQATGVRRWNTWRASLGFHTQHSTMSYGGATRIL